MEINDIARLRADVARSEQLKKRLQNLYKQREALAAQEAELREARLDEAEDVENLEGRSLARFIYSLTGSLDDKLEKERAEARAAAVKHDSVVRELEDLDDDIAETGAELRELSGCEVRYSEAIHLRAAELKASGSSVGGRLRELERARTMMEARRSEAQEAVSAGERALAAANEVVHSLEDSSDMATLDLFTDSFFVNMAKYSSIDEAQGHIERLRMALRRFDTELADVGDSLNVDIGDFLGFADFFFDGLFTDLASKGRIDVTLDRAYDVEQRINSSLERLRALQSDCDRRIEELESEYESLVAGA